MKTDPRFIPGYISPLTDLEHARLGRIAILWGQVENSLDSLLPLVSGQTWDALATIGVTDKNVNAKCGYLKQITALLDDAEKAGRVVAFCESINLTKVARNHAFHGMWGWRANHRNKTVIPCARHPKYPSKPLTSEDLRKLEKELCATSRLGMNLLYEYWGWQDSGASRFFHGREQTFEPWLQQWTERNPPSHELLDQNMKAGELPRLAQPYPRK